jgi:hypothetical protein
MQIKTVKSTLHTHSNGRGKKTDNTNLGKDVEKVKTWFLAGKSAKCHHHFGKQFGHSDGYPW